MKDLKLRGLLAAPYTPLNSSGDLALSVVERQAARLIDHRVTGAFVCGTTGEALALSIAERMDVARRWVEVAARSLTTIVHVGENCQRHAMELAAHAQKIGASAIAAMPPSFFRPATVAQAVDFMKPIAAAAPELPFYYYHIPSMTGVALPMVDLIEVALREIPTFHGLKFTHNDLGEFQRCNRLLSSRGDMAWGTDELLLAATLLGAVTAVGSTYNFAAPLYTKMLDAFAGGDLETARACSRQVTDLVCVLNKFGGRRSGKALMQLVGIDCGPSRPPQPSLAPQEVEGVRAALEQIGLGWLLASR